MASLFALTPQFNIELNAAQTMSLLERCSSMEELKQIHSKMLKTGLVLDSIAVSRLLAFSSSPNLGDLNYARMVFERISRPNTFMWNAMIKGYASSNEPEQALNLYQQMLWHSVPRNAYTFPFLLKACSSLSAFEETQQIHGHTIKLGFGSEVYASNSLLHAYTTSGSIQPARLLFDRIPLRDIVSWNSMLAGYMKFSKIETANELFKDMPEKNAISWTTMISGYVQAGLDKEALDLFQEMQIAGVKPDNVELASALSACAHLGALDQGRWIHAYINRTTTEIDPILGCVLTDMYAKCGSMQQAVQVFKKLEKKGVAVWTAIISGFAIHGRGREALDWFLEMQKAGIKPNPITFTAVLTGCSYAGLVEEGKSLFESMDRVYSLNPTVEHYGCVVDLLGRAGLLVEANDLIQRMPVKPNAVIWGALLKACRIHGELELGKHIGRNLIKMDPDDGSRYIHLASVHAAARDWDGAAEARRQMKECGVAKVPGCSTIFLKGTGHGFFAGDRSHPQREEISRMWHQIAEQLRQQGYKPATQDLLLDLDDKEKEIAINQHSEKLAIAFGLIRTKPGTTIHIFKNLTVCEDCHTVTKLISKIYGREIVMRDRTRFHHFRDGECTCGDYW